MTPRFLPLLSTLLLASLPAPVVMAAEHAPIAEKNLPGKSDQEISKLVETFFARMSLDDKLAEIQGVRPNDLLDENGKISLKKCKTLIPHGIGEVCQFTTSLKFTPEQSREMVRAIQHYLMTKTHARVPALFQEEMITGFPTLGCTTYPQHIGMGCTWNPDLVEQCARLTSQSSRKLGGTQALSPMVDITRTSYWERMEEGFGEDACLTSRLGLAFVEGLQGTNLANGVAATTKHFAAYGAPEVSEAEFYDEFLMPHEAAISLGNLSCVMPSYGTYKGTPTVGSKELLTGILRDHLGFEGLTISDYGSVHKQTSTGYAEDFEDAAVKALNAGNDVELERSWCYPLLKEALKKGLVSQATIDTAVRRSLTLKARLGLLDTKPQIGEDGPLNLDPPGSRRAAYNGAVQSVVLLKNDGTLPLSPDVRKIALVGPNSDSLYSLVGDYTYQALAAFFWNIPADKDHPRMVTLLDGLRSRLGKKITLLHERGCDWSVTKGGNIDTNGDDRLKKIAKDRAKIIALVHQGVAEPDPEKAMKIAAESDVIVAAMGENLYLCGEGRKRDDIRLPGDQEEFVKRLVATGKPVVLVLFGGRAMVLNGLEKECAAVLEAWYPGEEGGNAIADILLGKANPSGKLCTSYPAVNDRTPLSYNNGYTGPSKPIYPFGYGLSYTTYGYSDLKVAAMATTADKMVPASFKVKNTGSRAGTEIVQLYVSPKDENSTLQPIRLKGFRRVELAPGQEKTVTFNLSPEQLCSWKDGAWVVEPGTYSLRVGGSSANLPLETEFSIEGKKKIFKKRKHFWCS